MAFRFLHTADWQLGKPFGQLDPALASRLTMARQDGISLIAEAAKTQHVQHIIVAGDIWDNETPSNATVKQPIDIMAEYPELTWWLMPGNHDVDDARNGLWDRVEAFAPANLRLLRQAEPVEMGPDVWLLPCPWTRLHHGQDLTAWMDRAETPEGAIRIGVAHGGVKTFGSESADGDSNVIIAPDRASRARLDYLALGDWHGLLRINDRTYYSGTPEPDRFKSGERGQALLVEIEHQGAKPDITPIPTARFDWVKIDLNLFPGNPKQTLKHLRSKVSTGRPKRDTLAQVILSGKTTPKDWEQLQAGLAEIADETAYFEIRDEAAVRLILIPEDIQELDAQGSVRQAAETLQAQRDNPNLSQADRDLAEAALRLLFSFAATEEASG